MGYSVSLFIPCAMDALLPDAAGAVAALLETLGCEPVYHHEQTCCGLMAYNAGYHDQAARIARHFIEIFERDEAIVCPGGSCAGMVRAYPELFAQNTPWRERARAVARKTHELCSFIVDVLGITDVGAAWEGSVAYHESCSLKNGLGISEQPRALIRGVRGANLLAMNDADVCCGFGGNFANRYPYISGPLASAKVKNFIESSADLLLVAEPGCLLNIQGYLRRYHPEKQALHLAQFLYQNLVLAGGS